MSTYSSLLAYLTPAFLHGIGDENGPTGGAMDWGTSHCSEVRSERSVNELGEERWWQDDIAERIVRRSQWMSYRVERLFK